MRIGNRVVAFYEWTDRLGGRVSGNALIAAHGGIYRTLSGPRGATVLGRGQGYAVAENALLATLGAEIERACRAREEEGGRNEAAPPRPSRPGPGGSPGCSWPRNACPSASPRTGAC